MKNIAISLPAFNCCLFYSSEKDSVSHPDELTVISATSESAAQFSAFSGNRVFANTSAALWDVRFQKAVPHKALQYNPSDWYSPM